MIPFLKSIVIELSARYGSGLSRFCFVLPSRRSLTFLHRYIEDVWAERMNRRPWPGELPEFFTIGDFIDRLSDTVRGSRIELLFSMFDAWRSLPDIGQTDFDKFRAWGETLVSDFNEVDMYDVDPRALFANMADFNEIQTDYLTPEQRSIIERYFGVTAPEQEVARFWKHFNPDKTAEKRFLSLWERLYPLYCAYNRILDDRNIAYPGKAYRKACDNVEARGAALLPYDKVVFAGFNALSAIERRLFGLIRGLRDRQGDSLAEFFWDAPGIPLHEDSPVDAGHFLHVNAKDFPCSIPQMRKYTRDLTFPPRIEVTACPGNTAQAKVISTLVEDIVSGEGENFVDPARVAVVLPDEGLLFPVFHSLPRSVVENVNLTMGYPLRMTEIASFLALIRRLHLRARRRSGASGFYYKDVEALLAHTLTHRLLGAAYCTRLQQLMRDSRRYFLSPGMLAPLDDESAEAATLLWQPLGAGIAGATALVESLLVALLATVAPGTPVEKEEGEENVPLQALIIRAYITAARELRESAAAHSIEMDGRHALGMIDKLLNTHSIPLQGEPLTGLQVMGMLETRALDFDYLIIPSLNERIFPRRLRPRTFIPDALRRGFGIATVRFQESIFAYYFYRLIARARRVHLLYDASQGGLRSGDPSRYLLQLRHLFPGCQLDWNSARFTITSSPAPGLIVGKHAEVRAALERYLSPDSGRSLSASSLKDYMACPMKFYLKHIAGKSVEREPDEFMDAVTQGNILHETMQEIYNSLPPGEAPGPREITEATVRGWLDGTRPIGRHDAYVDIVREKINLYYTHAAPATPLTGDAELISHVLLLYVKWCLEADLRLTPFTYLASEMRRDNIPYTLPDGRTVNMTMIIDRLDRIRINGQDVLRISDYKTGGDPTDFKNTDEIFSPAKDRKAIFQLMLYAALLPRAVTGIASGRPIALAIYKTRELQYSGYNTAVTCSGTPVDSHLPYLGRYRELLDTTLSGLFDFGTPFTQTASPIPCAYCDYRPLCNR